MRARKAVTDANADPISGAEINRSVERALGILLEVARSAKPLGFVELQQRMALPKGTLHKLLATLEALRFLRRDRESGKYSVGPIAYEFAVAGAIPGDIETIVGPILEELCRQWNETCVLAVFDAGDIVYRDVANPMQQVVRLTTTLGIRLPGYSNSLGKATLAALPDDAIDKLYPTRLPITATPNTLKTRKDLKIELNATRKRGYALDLEEQYLGVRCVSVAIPVPGWPLTAIGFRLPLQRAPVERLHELAKPLVDAARQIETKLRVTRRDL